MFRIEILGLLMMRVRRVGQGVPALIIRMLEVVSTPRGVLAATETYSLDHGEYSTGSFTDHLQIIICGRDVQ
jgi:hypothetical protein